jgi:hypothetical protein
LCSRLGEGAMMRTAEQCRAYAAEYQRLGQEADISIQRAFELWNWWEERVPKKRTSTPMEIQPASGPRPDAIPMGSSPSKPKRSSRPSRSASAQANAAISRRSSLRNQRSQMETIGDYGSSAVLKPPRDQPF